MAINKVIYQNDVLIDITDSTVTPNNLNAGVVAYAANGERIVGTNVGGGNPIIDVFALPTEDIHNNAFYRLLTAKFVSDYYIAVNNWKCYCVNGLPEIGNPVSTDFINITAYYNTRDGEVYGYADNQISAAGGVPVGWYPIGALAQAFNIQYGGVITDISESSAGTAQVLVSCEYYVYNKGWTKLIFASQMAPKHDIQWNGDMTDHVSLDLSLVGYESGLYCVKVSDDVFTTDDMMGFTIRFQHIDDDGYDEAYISESSQFDSNLFPGCIVVCNNIVICYDENQLSSALGIPSGMITNGTYFMLNNIDGFYVSQCISPQKITKIPGEYIDFSEQRNQDLHLIAFTGDYMDLNNLPDFYNKTYIDNKFSNVYTKSDINKKFSEISNNIDLTQYAKTTDVETMIHDAIGSAIGGSY